MSLRILLWAGAWWAPLDHARSSVCLRITVAFLVVILFAGVQFGPAPAVAQTPVDCIVYMTYNPDLGDEKNAYNKDIKSSAEALEKQAKDKGKDTVLDEVHKKKTFDDVFAKIVKDKKCCRKIDIVGHGTPDGAMLLPYDNPGATKLDENEQKGGGVNSIGGPKATSGDGAKWLSHFVATIKGQKAKKPPKDKNKEGPLDYLEYKDIPSVLCPQPANDAGEGTPTEKPTVTFNTCWAGKASDGVAEQGAKEGLQTKGWTGSCKFPTGKVPQAGTGEQDSGSRLEKFTPPETKTSEKSENKSGGVKKSDQKRRRAQRYKTNVGQPFGENVSRATTGTDSEKWCTYTDGVGFETTLIETDENGVPIEITTEETTTEETTTTTEGEPTESAGTPTVPETPEPPDETHPQEGGLIIAEGTPTAPEKPKPPAEVTPSEPTPETPKPPETATPSEPTPETPKTTEPLPPTPETPETTEKPPEEPISPIPDTIFVKAKESVLEGQPTGNPIENQVVKLFPPEEPELPGEGGSKEAQDTGFDKDPVECTTAADGNCAMHVPTEDRALYDLPSTGAEPGKNYRIDYDLPQTSGGVAETTGKPTEPDVKTGTPESAQVTYEEFKIGDRTFVRLVYEQPYGENHDFDEQFKPIFGESYEQDDCRDKQPGAPLGMEPHSYSSLNRELPETTLRLSGAAPAPGDSP